MVPRNHTYQDLQDVDKRKEKEARVKNYAKTEQPPKNEREQPQSDLESQLESEADQDDINPFAATSVLPDLQIPDVPSNTPTLSTTPLLSAPPIPSSSTKPKPGPTPKPKAANPKLQAEDMTMKVGYFKGTGEDEDARTWIQDFEYKMVDAEWDDQKAARMFEKLMREGTPAAAWFKTLKLATQAKYTEIKKEFDVRWPPKERVAQSTKELQQRVLDTILTEADAGTVVEDPERGTIGAHVLWAEKLVQRAAAAGDTQMHLYLAAKDRFPKAVKAFLQTAATEPETWEEFQKMMGKVSATQLKKHGEDRSLLDALSTMDLSALAEALRASTPTQPAIPAFSQPRYYPSPSLQAFQQPASPMNPFAPSTPINRQPSLFQQLNTSTAYMSSPGTPTPNLRMPPGTPTTPTRGAWSPQGAQGTVGPITPRTATVIKLDGFADTNQGWADYHKASEDHKEKWGNAPPDESRPPPRGPGTQEFGDDDCWTCGRRYHGRGIECKSPKRLSDVEIAHRRMVGMRRTRAAYARQREGSRRGPETQVQLVEMGDMTGGYDYAMGSEGNGYGLGGMDARDPQSAMYNPRYWQ